MDILWEDQQLRQQTLNQFGQSTGMYYQFYHFGETAFYFSDNISDLIGDIPQGYFSKSQWYSLIYEPDRKKLQQYTRQAFHKDEEQYSFNYRIRNRQGQLIWVSSQGKCIFDQQGNPLYFFGFLTPRNDREFEGGHNHQAALLQKLRSVHSQGQEGYLLLVDVDNLSRINLKYGRMFGDGVLLDLAEAMSHGGPGFSHPFRNNGSCFCTLAIGVSRNEVEDYFAALQQTMYGQCTLSGGCVSLQKYQVPDSDMLIHYAESALDSAKLAGKAQLFFFNPENYERKLSAIELQADLEAAVKDHFAGFSLQYQPQVRSETFELAGTEALLRFVSPKQGAVSPAEFVPILERTGLIIPVGMWVLRTVLEQCRLWRQELPDFRISVNMSYVQLSRPEIQAEVLDALRESGLPGSALTLEVTEGTELQEYTYLNTIFSAWKKEGIEISVDDFGTGYSSLSWLKKLAIDEIKIDRCFVSGIQHSAYNLRLLDNIIELANSRCLQVCCEGVETEEELTTLETLQPGLYQGFFFSRPLSPEDFSPQDLQQRLQKKHRKEALPATVIEQAVSDPGILEHAILEKTEDAISVCDIRTYEVYYLKPAGGQPGQKPFQCLQRGAEQVKVHTDQRKTGQIGRHALGKTPFAEYSLLRMGQALLDPGTAGIGEILPGGRFLLLQVGGIKAAEGIKQIQRPVGEQAVQFRRGLSLVDPQFRHRAGHLVLFQLIGQQTELRQADIHPAPQLAHAAHRPGIAKAGQLTADLRFCPPFKHCDPDLVRPQRRCLCRRQNGHTVQPGIPPGGAVVRIGQQGMVRPHPAGCHLPGLPRAENHHPHPVRPQVLFAERDGRRYSPAEPDAVR